MTLRSDNADLRLTEKGDRVSLERVESKESDRIMVGRMAGAVSHDRWWCFESTRQNISRVKQLLQSVSLSPQVCLQLNPLDPSVLTSLQGWAKYGFDVRRDGISRRFDRLSLCSWCIE